MLETGAVLMLQVADANGDGGSDLPDWLIVGIVVVAVLLALLSVALMVVRTRPARDDSEDTDATRYPQLTREPVLIISALVIVVLALVVLRTEY